MSSSTKDPSSLSKVQFAIALGVLAVCAVVTLVLMAGVAGKHGRCPGETQVSRPGAATCYAAYQNQNKTGVVGIAPKP